jgi:hypothetical protein
MSAKLTLQIQLSKKRAAHKALILHFLCFAVTWMVEDYLLAQACAVYVGIDFGGGDALVPKHNLNDAQVGTTLEQMSGK